MTNQVIQILLIIVVCILTSLLVAIGIEVFLTLKEIRRSVKKMNHVLSVAEDLSESIARPFTEISGILSNLVGLASFLNFFNRKKEIGEGKKK